MVKHAPALYRKQYVRLLGAVYEAGEMLHSSGAYGIVLDFSSHPWVGVRGLFVAKVRLRSGKTVYVNERALEPCYGPI